MTKAYDVSIIVGRFQPFHKGHEALIEKALALSDKLFLFVGHCGFTDTRHFIDVNIVKEMILKHYENTQYHDRIEIIPLYDMADDSKWVLKLSMNINTLCVMHNIKNPNICFVGCKKDVIWYVDLLPNWELLMIPPYKGCTATRIRKSYFCTGETLKDELPNISLDYLNQYKETDDYKKLSKVFKSFYSIID